MALKLTSIADVGDIAKERVVMRVSKDTEIGRYLLARGVRDSEQDLTNEILLTFWFPDGPVKEGDFVVLYSKAGENKTKKLKSSKTSHFYYWGQTESVWSDANAAAVLFNAPQWQTLETDAPEEG